MTAVRSDIEIARTVKLRPIEDIAAQLGLEPSALHPYGRAIAKVDLDAIARLSDKPDGKLILVTAISPTPAGEGKTTTTIGLGDGLRAIGKRAMICVREPSLGPCFGQKGGATGGGRAQVLPMETINLHFTGDFHAITSAHNLLAALLDNHIHWGNALGIDPRRVQLRRVMDMNDRALRQIVGSLGGPGNGYPRQDGFDITVASEVMAIFCLARTLADLEQRLGRMVVAQTSARAFVTAAQLQAHGAMTVLLRDAFMPNLVQTIEGSPAFVHGGPFANIAHGCNTVMATTAALKLADYVVTEAGFGADLGAEKFFDIKCRKAGLVPAAAVIVATVRALKMHGGVQKEALSLENTNAVRAGLANLQRHVENVRKFGVPVVVAVNHFGADTLAEHEVIADFCRKTLQVEAITCRHWADGARGIEELARHVVALAEAPDTGMRFAPLYPDAMPLIDKVRAVAREIYRADGVTFEPAAHAQLEMFQSHGFGHLPVCIAKTQYSFSTDPTARGAPTGHTIPVRDVRLSAGAEFVVVICGEILTMPGLPKVPAAHAIRLDENGQIDGLF